MEKSERLNRQERSGAEPGTSRLPALTAENRSDFGGVLISCKFLDFVPDEVILISGNEHDDFIL